MPLSTTDRRARRRPRARGSSPCHRPATSDGRGIDLSIGSTIDLIGGRRSSVDLSVQRSDLWDQGPVCTPKSRPLEAFWWQPTHSSTRPPVVTLRSASTIAYTHPLSLAALGG